MTIHATHQGRLLSLLRLRVFGVYQVALNRLLYGLVVPVLIIWLILNVVPVAPERLASGAAAIAAGFMMMRVPAVTFTEEHEAGLHRLLMQMGHARTLDICKMHVLSAAPLAILPALSFFAVLAWMSPAWGWLHLVPLYLLILWFFGLGLCLLQFRLSLIAVQLVADLIIVGILVFCPILYSISGEGGTEPALLSGLPPTLFYDVVSNIAIDNTLLMPSLVPLLLWTVGTCALGAAVLKRRL